ncbi:hypothetical protein [Bradyrhizobium elkanii]
MSRNFGINFAPRSGFLGAKAAAGDHRQPRLSPAPVAASIQTMPASPGGNRRSPACHGAKQYISADSIPLAAAKPSGSLASLVGLGRTLPRQDEGASFSLPSGSLIDPGSSPFERGDFIQTVRDCVPVIGAFLFLTVTAIAVAASTFMMFFCEF